MLAGVLTGTVSLEPVRSLAGMSRSVTVAVAYIMSVTTLTWKEALKVVRVGRAVANPNFGFQRQLQEFEAYRLGEVSDPLRPLRPLHPLPYASARTAPCCQPSAGWRRPRPR